MNQMHLFVWTYIEEGLTDNWHSGGGAIAIATSEDRAEELIKAALPDGVNRDTFNFGELFYTCPVGATDEMFVIFPDKGCC